jgi:hypothetical protein
MTTMLEKTARALFDSYVRLSGSNEDDAEPYWLAQKDGFLVSARAALEAIREVDEETFWAGQLAMPITLEGGPGDVWLAMIDAILEERPA